MTIIAYLSLVLIVLLAIIAFCMAMNQIYVNKKAIKEIISPMGLEFNEEEEKEKPALRKKS
jgi:hypothetical protein